MNPCFFYCEYIQKTVQKFVYSVYVHIYKYMVPYTYKTKEGTGMVKGGQYDKLKFNRT